MSKFVLTAQLQLQAPNNVKQVVQQIQSQLQGVNVNIQVQGSPQAQKQLQQVTQQANQATTAAERMGKAFALSIRRFAAFSIATRAVGLFTSSLGSAVDSAIDFERQLIKVAQVTGKSVSQLRGLTKQITSLSTGLGVASSDLLEVSTVLAQAGLSAEDTSVALKTLAKAALAPNFDSITETAEGAIAILAQFQEGVGALEKQLGSINAVAGAFAVEASDLIDVVRRTGGVFKASGGNLNELLALFTSVRATTRESAESIGTGLRTIFTRIQRPKTIEFLKQFGVELVDLNGKFVGPYEAIKRLSEALSGLGEGDLTFISIAEELGGFRQIGKVLPLLQQFSTAQQALNVAMKAGDSLTNDAASAQAALAIRIMKVKEEFLALIRSMTETSTFQIMANTALSLASALIKIGDSIKPLLPMLAALAGFKLIKGMSSFFGGMMSGAASGRTYNKGGKVLGFARGGLVPGSGNRDTVPAMLSPGEFVIRKSSVKKMGAGTLAAMNENRFEEGGPMTTAQKIAAARAQTMAGKKKEPQSLVTGTIKNAGKTNETIETSRMRKGVSKFGQTPVFRAVPNQIGAFVLDPPKSTDDFYKAGNTQFNLSPNSKLYKSILKTYGGPDATVPGTTKDKMAPMPAILEGASYPIFYPGLQDVKKSKQFSGIVSKATTRGFQRSLNYAISEIQSKNLISANPAFAGNPSLIGNALQNMVSDTNLRASLEGYLFEGIISSITGATTAGGRANFDLPYGSLPDDVQNLQSMFGQDARISKLLKAEVKRSKSLLTGSDGLSKKIQNDINVNRLEGIKLVRKQSGGLIQKFAVGGEAQAIADKLGKGKSRTWWSGQAYGKQLLTDTSLAGVWDAVTGQLVKLDPMQGKMLREMAMREQASARPQPALRQESEADLKARLEQERKAAGDAAIARAKSMSADSDKSMIEIEQKNKTKKINESIRAQAKEVREATRDYRYMQRRKKFAVGGGVGTDTVPALLTPGEFVVNRSSAQRIGYGNLNRMNKVGKYAKGGVVQHFAAGTSGTGVKKIPGSDMLPSQSLLSRALSVLTTSFTSQRRLVDETSNMFNQIKKASPDLAKALYDYARSNVSSAKQNYDMISAYKNLIDRMYRMGLSNSKIDDILQQYIVAIENDTKSKQQSSNATNQATKSTQTAAATPTKASGASSKSTSSKSTSGAGSSNKPSGGGVVNMVNDNKMMAAAMTTSMIQGFLPAVDESSSALVKVSHSLLGLVTTVTSVGFALEAFGLKLNAQNMGGIMDFLGGKGNAGNKITEKLGLNRRAIGQQASFLQSKAGGGLSRFSALKQATQASKNGFAFTGSGVGKFTSALGKSVQFLTKLAGPLTAIAGSSMLVTQAFNTIITSMYDYDNQLKKAVESGNIDQAKEIAGKKAGLEASNMARAAGATGGAAIGFVLGGPIGAAIGAAIGAGVSTLITGAISSIFGEAGDRWMAGIASLFGGSTYDSTVALAAAQAGAVKTQKALDKAQKVATESMDEFTKGSISASQALLNIRTKSSETISQQKRAGNFATGNLENFSRYNGLLTGGSLFESMDAGVRGGLAGGIPGIVGLLGGDAAVRNTLTLGGLLGESSWDRNARLDKEGAAQIEASTKQQAEAFNIESPARQAAIRSNIARGKGREAALKEATTYKDPKTGKEISLQQRISEQRLLGNQLQSAGSKEAADAAFAAAEQMDEQLKQINKELDNIENEVKRQKDLYDAMNLGLRAATATSSALSATMDRFSAGFEVGGSTLGSDIEFLQQSMSSAAQAMDPKEIKDAVSNVSSNLREFGVGDEYIKKFEGNVAAFTSAQQNYNKAFDNIKNSMADKDFKALSAKDLKTKFADELTKGMDKEGAKSLKAAIQGMDLSDTDVDQIIAGDLSVFGDKLTEVQKKMFEDLQKIAQERAKAEQVLIDFTKKRIDAERNLVAAQQEALDLAMEGREVQGKYGGRAVTNEERKSNLLAKSNVEAKRLGLSEMKTGSIGELRARNAEIRGGFADIEARRQKQGGMSGKKGVEADEKQKDLEKAYKTQIDTIRNLIKLEEEQLKITQEKNKLEKESMESLIKGDVEEFFKKQSAVGATAAIASGDQRLMNLYGSEALGTAYQDIQRQQEAGVQTLYGQQLAGPGGLTEAAATAALSSRGVTDMRAAQVMAGTTGEEEASKARLRELGGVLGDTGQLGAEMAEMQVQTATINVNSAQLKFDEVMERGKKKAEEGLAAENKTAAEFKSRGGMIYASRGMFIPRGTDTIPAMLTPGEFVVNRAAVQRGNNLSILQAMNNGSGGVSNSGGTALMARGGMVRYRAEGSNNPEQPSQGMANFSAALENFNRDLAKNVESLKNTSISIKLDSTSVNVNLNDGGLLKALTSQVKQEIFNLVKTRLVVGDGGRLKENSGVI